ncbi:hypothetical protein N7494_000531 [Penicillium frequentans]|uniref:Secreted protein n=1 Tax=Penicillium frequentans TaxID=3151616 RepID=A0AAD6D6B8_9EURO|nr:hypothetical protein N7494_000531 [Penicillium glabrum]
MKTNTFLVLFTFISIAFGGTLQIIDYEDQCLVYSTDNFNCTGYSEPFAPLEGDSCSRYQGTGSEPNAVKVNLCNSHHHIAWVEVHRSGLLHFHNDQGDEASCSIDDPLVKGKSCTIGSIAKTSTSSMRPMPTSSDATSHRGSAKATGVTTSTSAASSKVPDPKTDC